jgi:hypothetical protein
MTTNTEWVSLCRERTILFEKIENFQKVETERIKEFFREKGDKPPADLDTGNTAPRINLMAIVVDGVRH